MTTTDNATDTSADTKAEQKADAILKDIAAAINTPRGKTIDELQTVLKRGTVDVAKKDGKVKARKLNVQETLKFTARLVRAGATVPSAEIASRFAWANAREAIERFAAATDTDVAKLMAALGLPPGKKSKPAKAA